MLNDEELKAFQLHCFNAPLAPEELTAVKQVVADKVPQGITAEGALTFHGFLFLHALFIERGRTETPWAVLRAYGYDGFLKLSDEVLDRVPFRRGADQVVELTDAAFGFLEGVFAEHAGGRDGALTKAALDALFSTAPARFVGVVCVLSTLLSLWIFFSGVYFSGVLFSVVCISVCVFFNARAIL